MNPSFNFKKYQELKERFRNSWDRGSNGAFEGVGIFNQIVRILQINPPFTVKEIVNCFYIENCDLVGLRISKLLSYLDYENRILYNKKR